MSGIVIAQTVGVDSFTRIAVIVVSVAALIAAVVAANVARSRPGTPFDQVDTGLLDSDLLGDHAATDHATFVVWYERAFLLVLVGYALFDRAFAWLHVPGTPLFVGEAVLGLGLLAVLSVRTPLRRAFRAASALSALAVWMVWGAVLLALHVPAYGLDAIRDSALWYYGAVAMLTVFLLVRDPSRFGRWTTLFTRVIPLLLLWFPIAMVLDILFSNRPPYVPDSTVSIFVHRFGNIGVLAASILAFIWLVDRERGLLSAAQRVALSGIAVILVAFVGLQNRGGMLAAAIGILALIIFMRSRRGELVLAVAAVGILLSALAIVSDVTIPMSGGREISAAQMADNIGSIINPDSGGDRQRSTTQWRLTLWTAVLDDVVNEHPIAGFGPGLDLGERYGVSGVGDEGLRNPHNSHLSVLARMGIVGFGLWLLMWIVWSFQLLLLRSRLLQRGRSTEAGLVAWLMITAVMILTNAVFDPTLEGPQVGFWLWTVFGLGCGMVAVYSGAGPSGWGRADRSNAPAVART